MAWVNVCDIMWPIGSIYCSTSPTPPGELFGGIWTQLDNNRVLMNTTSSNKLNTTVNSGLPNITGSIGSTGGSEPKFGTLSGCFTTLSTVNYYSGTTNTGIISNLTHRETTCCIITSSIVIKTIT